MSSLRSIIDKAKFASRQFDEVTTLTEDVDIDEADISFSIMTPGMSPGNVLEVDNEAMLITGTTSSTASVVRGYMGTPKFAYLNKTTARVSPRNFRFEIFDAIKAEMRSWPFSLYQVAETLIEVGSGVSSYSVDMGYSVIQGISLDKDTPNGWVRAYGKFTKPTVDDDTRAYFSLWDTEKAYLNYRVRVACRFDIERLQFDNQDMLLQAAGVPEDYEDIIYYGVLWRLRFPKEEARVADPPRGQTGMTAPQAAMQTGGGFLSLRDKRIGEESQKLYALHGIRL